MSGSEEGLNQINPKLFNSLPNELQNQFINTLSKKGLISRDHKSNGIKIIRKRLIELKIPENDRLYTDHIYQNSQGKYLIDFDHHSKHKKLKQVTQECSWKVIICEDNVSCTSNISKEVKETESSPQHITKEMEHVSVSEEKWVVKLSGNDYVE